MEKGGAGGKQPVAVVTGTSLEEKTNALDEMRQAAAADTHSPLHDANRGLLPERENDEEAAAGRERGHSNSDTDSSAVDSDEEEVGAGGEDLLLTGGSE